MLLELAFRRVRWVMARVGTMAVIALSATGCGSSASSDGKTHDERSSEGAASGSGGVGGSVSGGTGSASQEARGGSGGGDRALGGEGGVGSAGAGAATAEACTQPATTAGPPSCRTQADCKNGGQCMENAPTGAGLCGACFPTVRECSSDEACGADRVCVTEPTEPCQCMGPDTRCLPKCTADSCLATQVCGADGHCAPRSCEQGYSCPSGTVCAPERASGHGCAPARCDLNEMTCADGEVCDPTSALPESHCRAKRCSEGAVCPKNLRCGGANDYCERLPCTADADCDCGACIQGTCRDRLFLCVQLPA